MFRSSLNDGVYIATDQTDGTTSGFTVGDLLVLAGRGDRRSFERLYDVTSVRVHSLVRRQVGPERADDLTRQVYVLLWRQASGYLPADGNALAWVISVAGHVLAEDRLVGPVAAGRLRPGYLRTAIRLSSQTSQEPPLTRAQQDALTLVYLGGYTPGEVAQLLDLQPAAVTSVVREGLRRLQSERSGAV